MSIASTGRGELASSNLFVDARPRVLIQGEFVASVSGDVLEVEVFHDEDGLSRMELRLLNWGIRQRGQEVGFLHEPQGPIDLGAQIDLELGDSEDRHIVFSGQVTALEALYSDQEPPQIRVYAENSLFSLRIAQRTRLYEKKSDAQIANEIAEDHGLEGDTEQKPSGPRHERLLQVNQSDLGFLRERARAVDARVVESQGKLGLRAREEEGDAPEIAMTRGTNLVSFRVIADLSEQRRSVRVHGWSVGDGASVSEQARASVLSPSPPGERSGPEWIEKLRLDAEENLYLEQPADAAEARSLAESLMKSRMRRFVKGMGVTDGVPGLRVGGRVNLQQLGQRFDGRYRVCSVEHHWDTHRGLRTSFSCERSTMGAEQ